MSKLRFTPEQQRAIDSRTQDILVAAAAGSGKTAVLVERISTLIIQEHVDVEQLVVLTFTNAAAAQMKDRVRKRLQALLPTLDEPTAQFVQGQLGKLPFAAISTFHAYCIQILRQYYQYLDLDPGFKIGGDENVLAILKKEALDQTIETLVQSQESADQTFLNYFVPSTSLQALTTIITEVFEQTRSYASFDAWYQRAIAYVSDEQAINTLIVAYDNLLTADLNNWCLQLQHLSQALYSYPKNKAFVEIHQEKLAYIQELSLDEKIVVIQNFDFGKWPTIKKDDKSPESDGAHSSFNTIKDEIKKRAAKAFSATEIRQQQEQVKPFVKKLLEVVLQYQENFTALKQERSLVDFSDIEHLMIRLLTTQAEVQAELQQQIVEILVDEYQDTNEVQDTILKLLHHTGNRLFMVGDIKQAIYRFRLADPTIFLEKKNTYRIVDEPQDTTQELILLNKNFRSSQNILDTVNTIFERLFQLDIQYDTSEQLNFGSGSYDTEQLYYTKWHQFTNKDDADTTFETIEEQKATHIVNEVIRLVQSEQLFESKVNTAADGTETVIIEQRPVTFADIAILSRNANSALIRAVQQKFEAAKIPYSAAVDKGYFDAVEVNVMLALLNILENPYNSVAFLAYLRSPICALRDDELYEIINFYKEAEQANAKPQSEIFYHYFQYYCESAATPLAERTRAIEQQLELFHALLTILPLENVLERIYEETFYYNFVATLPNGKMRLANLDILVQLAREQTSAGKHTLYVFNRYIRHLQKNNRDYALAKPESDQLNTVQMMTIHKSKGLEFPIVFLIDVDRNFNEQDSKKPFQISKDYGLALKYYDIEHHIRYQTGHLDFINRNTQFDAKAEELRVLYVALTRPMHHLHIFLDAPNEVETPLTNQADILKIRSFGTALRSIYQEMTQGIQAPMSWQTAFADLKESINLRHFDVKRSQEETDAVADVTVGVQQNQVPQTNETLTQTIIANMNWQYPYQSLQHFAQKQTVTELKRRLDAFLLETGFLITQSDTQPHLIQSQTKQTIDATLFTTTPSFMQHDTQELSAMEKGTLYHLILEHFNWENQIALETQIETLIENQILTAEEAQVLDINRLTAVIADIDTQYFKKGYQLVGREIPFSFKYSAKKLYQESAFANETVLIQGKIDLLLQKENQFIVVDFKTDRLRPGQTVETLETRYQTQLELYQEAVKRFYETEAVTSKLYAIFQ